MHININLSDYMINIDKLRNLVRYQNAPRVSEETVAEHSFFVAAYVLKLHNYYNFDLKKALSIAILHDYAEVFISDIPHPIKKQFPIIEDCLKEAENKIIKEHISDDFSNWLSEFNNINTAEGCIVSLADILSVISYSKYEDLLKNSEVQKLYETEIQNLVNSKNGFKMFERISRFVLLSKNFEVGVELSAKQEIMRYRLTEIYEKEIKSMFN